MKERLTGKSVVVAGIVGLIGAVLIANPTTAWYAVLLILIGWYLISRERRVN